VCILLSFGRNLDVSSEQAHAVPEWCPSADREVGTASEVESCMETIAGSTTDRPRIAAGSRCRPGQLSKMVIDVADIDEMIEWTHRNGYEIDAKGRAGYGVVRSMGGLDKPFVDETRSVQ
jgi:hypothetical protein